MEEKKIKYCEVCGVSSETKGISFDKGSGMTLCQKHRMQFRNYGKFFDSNKITCNDFNEISQDDNFAYISLYDKYGNKIHKARIDKEDVDKIKQIRWRVSIKRGKVYVVGGSPTKNNMEYLARFILDYNGELEVDHIDGNTLHNEKDNLRVVERYKNTYNLKYKFNSKTKIRGVSYNEKRDIYVVDFSHNKNRIYFKNFKNIEDAVYIRYLCEIYFYKEYRYYSNDDFIFSYINNIDNTTKYELDDYFNSKLKEMGYEPICL